MKLIHGCGTNLAVIVAFDNMYGGITSKIDGRGIITNSLSRLFAHNVSPKIGEELYCPECKTFVNKLIDIRATCEYCSRSGNLAEMTLVVIKEEGFRPMFVHDDCKLAYINVLKEKLEVEPTVRSVKAFKFSYEKGK